MRLVSELVTSISNSSPHLPRADISGCPQLWPLCSCVAVHLCSCSGQAPLLRCVLSLHCSHTPSHLCWDQAMHPTARGALSLRCQTKAARVPVSHHKSCGDIYGISLLSVLSCFHSTRVCVLSSVLGR